MFGYLRMYKESLDLSQRKIYRDYYCGVCLALKYNYGHIARNTLSYDVGYFALILFPADMKLEPCGKCGKCISDGKKYFQQIFWHKIAMYHMLLIRMKLMDNIEDGTAKISNLMLQKFFQIWFCKLELEIKPYLHYYADYVSIEKSCKTYEELEPVYIRFIEEPLRHIFQAPNEKIKLIIQLCRWIYFIDAVDDYEKDSRGGSFNIFLFEKPHYHDKKTFIQKEKAYLNNKYAKIYESIVESYKSCDFNRQQRKILENLIFESIPNVTNLVFEGKKLQHEKIL